MDPISVTYTPGSGYTGTIPNCSAKIRWGEEFWAEMNAKVKPSAGGAANTAPVSRKELTKDEIAELADQYDPEKMSQEEYDALLDELVERGYLTKNEIGRLGYKGAVYCGSLADGTAFGGSVTMIDVSKAPGGIAAILGYPLAAANGNILSWAKIRAIMEPLSASTEAQFKFAKDTSSAFEALVTVMEAMQSQRK